ncbi:MAG: tetratricopeptide repeat protein [Alphaproteobacteria bacterium]|nr:tetratricopeptide repeat protein [Alphaproteobacteria bacterium]MBV9860882.1 tetratricopeptide repeat protein [Alphaproteobacteria bacterium]
MLYEQALQHMPENSAIHVQCGHMLKEAGDLARAEQHYRAAQRLTPDDPDLALQLGHFYKIAGRPHEAELSFRKALELAPDWAEPAEELSELTDISADAEPADGSTQTPFDSPGLRNGQGGAADAEIPGAPRKLKDLLRRADAARDARKHRAAAQWYESALQLAPKDAALHIQRGHMLKEAGDLSGAERHYVRAQQLTPHDPDLALQFGHFYKVAGRLAEAEMSFRKALELDPDWPEPARELSELYRHGWRKRGVPGDDAADGRGRTSAFPGFDTLDRTGWDGLSLKAWLVPEVAPCAPEGLLHEHNEEVAIRWLGRRERTPWGVRGTLRGIDALRGFCVSATPIVSWHADLNGLRFHRAGALKGYHLKYENRDRTKKKYVFNLWYDFSQFREGLYNLELQFVNEAGATRTHHQQIVIGAPLSEQQYPHSDRLVSISAGDDRPLDEQINSRASMIRPAAAGRSVASPRAVLVQRVDQLGDLVVSIPALRRLRQLLPETRLVGLLSLANADLGRTLNLFDEVIAIDFPDDEWERRRVMPIDQQIKLRRRLAPFRFDIAIDLSEADVSRPLLQLSGAPFLVGFCDGRSPWLSATYEAYVSDPINDLEEIPTSTKILGMVEWFGTLLHSHSQIVRRADLDRDRLVPYGLACDDRFVVLHTGARLKFSQWPYYDRLSSMLLDQTELKVVMMTDDPNRRSELPDELLASERFQLLDQRLPFDDFDALLSFCTVYVGNDTGPSHLASLRGANVVNVFLARHNWNEWGHENRGYIISRRVPCAGCNVHHDPEECGKDFACLVNISVREVFETVMKFV